MDFNLFSGKELSWVRYWCPYPGTIHCGASSAFLTDPNERFFGSENGHLKKTAALLPTLGPLLLCGEPGLGKSTELQSITVQCKKEGGVMLTVDFREIAEFTDFAKIVFESPQWTSWVAGESLLTLVVDGVDEGIMRIPSFVESLSRELRQTPTKRLRLLLACRTAEWPTTAQAPLFGLWNIPEKEPRIFELCPLRREDVTIAADVCGVDSQKFFSAVYQAHVEPLAARPVTLAFLLKEFRATGDFGKTHRELYESGARTLCGEHDPRRSELTRRLRKTTAIATLEERMEAAREIAARTLLSGLACVEVTDATPVGWLAALETALFTSVRQNTFTFIHRTLAECLASGRLAKLPTLQLRRLLCHRDGREEHVVPQLAELAAWTAGYNPQFLEHLLRIDPAILLRSDVARIQGTHKADLVSALLEGAEREEIFDEPEYRRFYAGLSHPSLAAQLQPYVRNREKGFVARRLAFDIAEICRPPELVNELFATLRDEQESQQIREAASDALCDCMPEGRLSELIPLAFGEVGPDPQDSIRGDALKKLIPAVWAVRDALPLIHAPRDRNFMGSYEMFLRYDCPNRLTDEDVRPVLALLSEWQGCFDSHNSRKEFAEKVFCMALARLDDPAISAKIVQVWLTKSRNHHPFSRGKDSKIRDALEDDGIRRAYARVILNDGQTTKDDLHRLLSSMPDDWGILRKEDLPWLLEVIGVVNADRLPLWISAIHTAMWWWDSVSCWDLFIARRAEIPQLAEIFPLFSEINSPESRTAKARHLRHERRMRRLNDRRKTKPPLNAKRRISNDLRRFRDGKTDAWYRLFYDLSLKPGAVRYEHLRSEIVETPGWTAASDKEREDFQEVAHAFLLNHEDGYAKFGGLSNYANPGVHAVEFLKDKVSSDLGLQAAVSANWIRAMTGWLLDDSDRANELFALAYKINPEAAIEGMLFEAVKDRERHGHVFAFRRGKTCWDNRLSEAALDFMEGCISPQSVGSGIGELADLDVPAAEESVCRSLQRFQGEASARECLVETIASAIKHQLFGSWERISPALSQDDDLARAVFLNSAHDMERAPYAALSEEQIADLYLLMARLFPSKEDTASPSGTVSPRQSVTYARSGLLNALAARANQPACDQFLRLAADRPEDATWLRWRYRSTLTAKRRGEWVPLPVEIIERLTSNPQSRLINNEDDLLELILESLAQLQASLRSQNNPAVEDLWNHDGAGNQRRNFRPKDEEYISDYVARWMDRELGRHGLIVNREVQPIRARRTDILVQTNLPSGRIPRLTEEVSLSVTIEIKGCWNPSIPSAVETQLVNEYLRPFGRTHGVFLVAWFACPRWKLAKNSLRAATLEEAVQQVNQLCFYYDGKKDVSVIAGVVLDARLDE